MKLFNFFRRKKEKESEEIPEDIFLDLDGSLKKRVERSKEKEKIVLNILKENIFLFLGELSVNIGLLEGIDLKDSRSDERLKFIVMENLSNYIGHLKNLSKQLKKIEEEDAEKFIEILESTFLDFRKTSRMSREKATYLIGKEIRSVRECIGKFLEKINGFMVEEKKFFDEISALKEIAEISKKFSEINDSLLSVEEEKTGLENELSLLKENLEENSLNIERLKKTPEYRESLGKKEKIESLKSDLKKGLFELKNLADFKFLFRLNHKVPKKMESISRFEENFSIILIEEEGDLFLELLSEGKKEEFSRKLKKLRKIEVVLKETMDVKTPFELLLEDKLKYENSIEEIASEIEKREKAFNKLKILEEENKKTISLLVEKIDLNYKN